MATAQTLQEQPKALPAMSLHDCNALAKEQEDGLQPDL